MNTSTQPNKRVLIIGINFSPEMTGIGKYSGEMVDWLVNDGYDCTVLTSFPYYPYWEVQQPYKGRAYKKETLNNGKLNIYRCPLYIPKKPSGLKRVLHEASFLASAMLMLVHLMFKPKHDYVFCVSPPFHIGFLGLFYRAIRGGKILYHIQDLQIEAARDLEIIKSEVVFKGLFSLERFIMREVDFISSISKGMVKKIKAKIDRDILFFPNWVDIHACHPIPDPKGLKNDWNFKEEDKVVLYAGSIGEKQGLEVILDVAAKLREYSFIKFAICGTGPHKQHLINRAHEEKLDNISFFPLQEKSLFNQFLNMADLHLVLQKKSAGDLVMPSKLTTILAVGGVAVVTAEAGTTLHDVIRDNDMGVIVPPEDTNLLAEAIYHHCTINNDEIKSNARSYAENQLNINRVIKKVMNDIKNVEVREESAIRYLTLNRGKK